MAGTWLGVTSDMDLKYTNWAVGEPSGNQDDPVQLIAYEEYDGKKFDGRWKDGEGNWAITCYLDITEPPTTTTKSTTTTTKLPTTPKPTTPKTTTTPGLQHTLCIPHAVYRMLHL